MRPNSRNAFVLASGIHLFFAALLILSAFWKTKEKEVRPPTLELFAPPATTAEPRAERPEPLPSVSFDFTSLEPVAPLPDLPELPKPKPAPPKPEPKPEPTPQPQPPKPEPKPEPTPQPQPPKPKPEPKVNFSDFRRENPIRTPEPKPAPRPDPIEAPRVDYTAITRSLESMVSREDIAQISRQSGADQAALNAYFQRIKSAVRGAWAKPGGLHDSLRVTVSFHVNAHGVLSGVRIVSSSGNEIFDQSVLAAFARAGNVGPGPDRRDYSLRLEFRMTD